MPFRQAEQFFRPFKKAEKLIIESERHPSWVSFRNYLPSRSGRSLLFQSVSVDRRAVSPFFSPGSPLVPLEISVFTEIGLAAAEAKNKERKYKYP
jgi:hypothetical protein